MVAVSNYKASDEADTVGGDLEDSELPFYQKEEEYEEKDNNNEDIIMGGWDINICTACDAGGMYASAG